MKKYIDKLFLSGRLDLEKVSEITSNRIQYLLLNVLNEKVEILEINKYLKNNTLLIEIGKNFFVNRAQLEDKFKGVEEENYKEKLESEYFLNLSETELTKFKYYFKKKVDWNEEFELEAYKEKTYEEILDYGLKNSYVYGKWLENLNLEGTEFFDVHEILEDILKRDIKII